MVYKWYRSCGISCCHRSTTAQRTGKIEREVDERYTTLRLVGHLQAAHLEALQAHMEGNDLSAVLDLNQVPLVDVEVVRFLGTCETKGPELLHGPPYIREWIRREQERPG